MGRLWGAGTAAMAGLILAGAGLFVRRVAAPLERLTEAVERLRSGGRRVLSGINTPPEVGRLIGVFNHLAEELRQAWEKIADQDAHMEESIRERSHRAEESHARWIRDEKYASLGRLAGGVAQAIHIPLGIIQGFTQSLKSRSSPDTPQYNALDMVEKQTSRCVKIASVLRSLSRQDTSKMEEVDLNELLEETLLLVASEPRARDVTLECRLTPGLPRVRAVRRQLCHVLMSLVTDALDTWISPSSLVLRAFLEGGMVTLEVSCAGGAVTSSQRRGTARVAESGGLAGVHGVVHGLGGVIVDNTPPGSGRVIRAQFPAAV
jgi:signal transduction histidine kinase